MREILVHVFDEHRLRRMNEAEAIAAYRAHAERVVIEFGAEVRELCENHRGRHADVTHGQTRPGDEADSAAGERPAVVLN